MKGFRVTVFSNAGEWEGLVVSDPDHYQKDIDNAGDYLHYWHVLIMDKVGDIHTVDVDDITVIRTDSGLLPTYLKG